MNIRRSEHGKLISVFSSGSDIFDWHSGTVHLVGMGVVDGVIDGFQKA